MPRRMALKILAIFILCISSAQPMPAQDTARPFSESYTDISTEQAWNAAANAVREMGLGALNTKSDVSKNRVEFARGFPGFPREKMVRFKVNVGQTAEGKVQVTAVPTKVGYLPFPSEDQMKSLADEFFALLSREVGKYAHLGQTSQVKRSGCADVSPKNISIEFNEIAGQALDAVESLEAAQLKGKLFYEPIFENADLAVRKAKRKDGMSPAPPFQVFLMREDHSGG